MFDYTLTIEQANPETDLQAYEITIITIIIHHCYYHGSFLGECLHSAIAISAISSLVFLEAASEFRIAFAPDSRVEFELVTSPPSATGLDLGPESQ